MVKYCQFEKLGLDSLDMQPAQKEGNFLEKCTDFIEKNVKRCKLRIHGTVPPYQTVPRRGSVLI